MGQVQEMGKECRLIDFLYVDQHRVDSFLSQLGKGTLRSFTSTNEASEYTDGLIGADVKLAQVSRTKHTENKYSGQKVYDPYHSQLLELINALGLECLTSMPGTCHGRLVMLKGSIGIRDNRYIKSLFPKLINNDEFLKAITGSFSAGNSSRTQKNAERQQARSLMKIVGDMVSTMNDTVSLSVTALNCKISGVIREGCLTSRLDELTTVYGSEIPGEWFICGILDTASEINEEVTGNDFYIAMDHVIRSFDESVMKTRYKIIPILIYRTVTG